MDSVLALLGALLTPILNWWLGKSSDKAAQEAIKKEAVNAIERKNEEVRIMAAPDRSDDDVIRSLRKNQRPNNNT